MNLWTWFDMKFGQALVSISLRHVNSLKKFGEICEIQHLVNIMKLRKEHLLFDNSDASWQRFTTGGTHPCTWTYSRSNRNSKYFINFQPLAFNFQKKHFINQDSLLSSCLAVNFQKTLYLSRQPTFQLSSS